MSDSYYAWRNPRHVLPVENFDSPSLHHRSAWVPREIAALVVPRMAGFPRKLSPADIRDAIRRGTFDDDECAYFRELFQSLDAYRVRVFQVYGGISRYELARALIAADVDCPLVCEWMNCHVPGYVSTLEHHRTWDTGRARA